MASHCKFHGVVAMVYCAKTELTIKKNKQIHEKLVPTVQPYSPRAGSIFNETKRQAALRIGWLVAPASANIVLFFCATLCNMCSRLGFIPRQHFDRWRESGISRAYGIGGSSVRSLQTARALGA